MKPQKLSLILFIICAAAGRLQAENLKVVTWVGAYQAEKQEAYFDPYPAQTGVHIEVDKLSDGAAAKLRAMQESNDLK